MSRKCSASRDRMFDGELGQTSLSIRLQTFGVTTRALLLWAGLVYCKV